MTSAEKAVAWVHRCAETVWDQQERKAIYPDRERITSAIEQAIAEGVAVKHEIYSYAEVWKFATPEGRTYQLTRENGGRTTWHETAQRGEVWNAIRDAAEVWTRHTATAEQVADQAIGDERIVNLLLDAAR